MENHSVGKSCPRRDFLNEANNAFRQNKILTKISEYTVTQTENCGGDIKWL